MSAEEVIVILLLLINNNLLNPRDILSLCQVSKRYYHLFSSDDVWIKLINFQFENNVNIKRKLSRIHRKSFDLTLVKRKYIEDNLCGIVCNRDCSQLVELNKLLTLLFTNKCKLLNFHLDNIYSINRRTCVYVKIKFFYWNIKYQYENFEAKINFGELRNSGIFLNNYEKVIYNIEYVIPDHKLSFHYNKKEVNLLGGLENLLDFQRLDYHYWMDILIVLIGKKLRLNRISKIKLENFSYIKLLKLSMIKHVYAVNYHQKNFFSLDIDILVMIYREGFLMYDIRSDGGVIDFINIRFSKTIEGLEIEEDIMVEMINKI